MTDQMEAYYWRGPDSSRVPPIVQVEQVTDEQRAKARRAVCGVAADVVEARVLLAMLGLEAS